MRTVLTIFPVCLVLAACGNSLGGIGGFNDDVLLPEANGLSAFPRQEELDRDTNVLSGLFRTRQDVHARDTETELPGRGARGSTLNANAGMALQDVAIGTRLPFGEVGRVCSARRKELGQRIDQAARKGSDYALYDSAPGTAEPRTFYVTGFSDNCTRQFTASLALFGSPEFHEQLRYGLPAKEYPYSTTDAAYEKVKQSVCKVGRSKPCGSRIDRLKNTTVFISVYENFEDNARWADMLLHDGALLAAAVKTP